MNCTEFQNGLAEFLEGGTGAEAEAHRKTCAACAGLVADLEEISAQARLLAAAEEPGEHLRARILAAVEAEGLPRVAVPAPRSLWWGAGQSRWAVPAWAAAVAALLLLAFGVRTLQQTRPASQPSAVVQPAPLVDNDDMQFLSMVAKKNPGKGARYKKHLEAVNASIRDAKRSVEEDPGNELARERLIQAYDQKSALYEMAMAGSMR